MKIRIFEPELITRGGFNGFYGYFLSALIEYAGARPTDEVRPLPRVVKPRGHESAWINCDGHLICFDMSDHVQFFDLDALERADVYFKANLHRNLTRRILNQAGMNQHESKIVPFLFFAEGLDKFKKDYYLRRLLHCNRARMDVCHVVGVYDNFVREGGQSPCENQDVPMTPQNYHFWIRWHMQQALKKQGITGHYRLTSRGKAELEDHRTVYPNLSRRAFSRCITDGRITVVNTFPHAVLPWKASESFILGRPLLLEQKPLTECPQPFELKEGVHFLEFLPGTGDFDETSDLDDPASYRVLTRIPIARFSERAAWLKAFLVDRERLVEMGQACRTLAVTAYSKEKVAAYICDQIRARIH